MLTLGVDLAWQSPVGREPNETGVIALEDTGAVMDADWVRGIDAAVEWVDSHRLREPVCFVDAPLVVNNENGQRWCEKEVGRHYGSDYVSANSTNLSQGTARLGGVRLNRLLTSLGWQYDDGRAGPSKDGLCFVECYPYTTLVGALGFSPRPAYKRRPTSVPSANWPSHRAAECRRIVEALETTAQTIAPISLSSHRVTADLLGEVPTNNSEYKHFRGPTRRRTLCMDGSALAPTRTIPMPGTPRPDTPKRTCSYNHRPVRWWRQSTVFLRR